MNLNKLLTVRKTILLSIFVVFLMFDSVNCEKKNSTIINWLQKTTLRPPARSLNQLDSLISTCFRSVCKDWMDECHWFCDSIKGQNTYWRCMECLSSRGQHCFDCFGL